MTRWVEVSVSPGHPGRSLVEGTEEEATRTEIEGPEDGGGELVTFAASTETEDRAGDVVLASGWELEAFKRNPVFLWAHRHDQPPIGRVVETWVEGASLMATVSFAPTPFAQEIAALYRGGYLAGVSVGFRALEFERRKSSAGRPATLFVRQELLEISAAPVPLNAEALVLPGEIGEARSVYAPGTGDIAHAASESEKEQEVEVLAGLGRLWQGLAELV